MRNVINKSTGIHHILFIAEDVTLAHVTRLLVLAKSLGRGQYEVSFATGKRSQHLIEPCGYRCHTIPTLSSQKFLDRIAKGRALYTLDELKTSVRADLQILTKLSPDLVVGDFRLSLGISAGLCGIPYAALTNAHWSPYSVLPLPLPDYPLVDILGVGISRLVAKIIQPTVLRYHAAVFNSLCKAYGLPPFSDVRQVLTYGDWTLYADIPSLAPTSNLPDNHLYLGPILWTPNIPVPNWWDNLPDEKPILYVTLGSSGDITFMNTIFEAIDEMPLIAMVASAGRFEIDRLPKNVFMDKYLPGLEASRRASLVLCSGGSATTYQALSCGVPVLGLPFNADQYCTMGSVARQGAGLLIRSRKVTRQNIRGAITSLLEDGCYRNAARRLRDEFLRYDAPTRFLTFVDSLQNVPWASTAYSVR